MNISHTSRIQRVMSTKDYETNKIQTMRFTSFGDSDELTSDLDSETEVFDAEKQAEMLIEQAENDAQKIVIKTQNEAKEIKDKAFQSGYEAGLQIAEKEINEAIERMSQVLTNAIRELASLKDEIVANAEDDLINLTMVIAKKLVCRELKQHPEFIIDVIKEAIKTAKMGNEITILINPEDRTILEQHANELLDFLRSVTFDQTAKIMIEDDPALTHGGCVITTDTNILDMAYESRLESVMEAITSEQLTES